MKLSKDDKFCQVKLTALKAEKQQDLESVEAFERKNKKMKRKRTIVDMSRHKEAYKSNKIKNIIDFDEEHTNTIKFLAVEKKSNVKLTTRFMKGKMLMFAKTSLQSSVYDMIDVCCFPGQVFQEICKKYHIEKCFMYQNLTDTDSTSLFFVFICNFDCTVNEKESRKILFEVMIASKIFQRLDLSDYFWKQYSLQNKAIKEQVGLYEIENIDSANKITISVNPKEYFEKYRDKTVNKKHKGLKRDTPGMNFEAYSQLICSLHEFFSNQKPKKKINKNVFKW